MDVKLLSTKRFIILNFITIGWYGWWWTYKSWKFFEKKDNEDLQVQKRLVFGILGYYYSLFVKIKRFSKSVDGTNSFSCAGHYLFLIVIDIFLGYFIAFSNDDLDFVFPLFCTYLFSFLWSLGLTKPFQSLNFAIKNSGEYKITVDEGFNNRQKALVVIGCIFWLLLLSMLL